MMEKSKRSLILIAFGFSLFMVVLGIVLIPRTKEVKFGEGKKEEITSARVVSVEPLENQRGVSSAPDIRIVFNQSVEKDKLNLEIIPKAEFELVDYKESKSEAIFRPVKALASSKNYEAAVKFGDQYLFRWRFTTKKLSLKDENLAMKINNIKKEMPRKTDNYLISYDAATDDFAVYVQKGNFSKEKNKAISWFKSFGLADLSVINISFIPRAAVRGAF